MSSVEEVDAYYSANYYRLANYIRNNKKGGDKTVVTTDAALEILHDTYCYHRTHPQHFSAKYIWNILKQRRMNYHRDGSTYDSMKEEFFNNFYKAEDWVSNPNLLSDLVTNDMKGVIKQEIALVQNQLHREILTDHIIRSKPLKISRDKLVVKRFRDKMLNLYGDKDDEE